MVFPLLPTDAEPMLKNTIPEFAPKLDPRRLAYLIVLFSAPPINLMVEAAVPVWVFCMLKLFAPV